MIKKLVLMIKDLKKEVTYLKNSITKLETHDSKQDHELEEIKKNNNNK